MNKWERQTAPQKSAEMPSPFVLVTVVIVLTAVVELQAAEMTPPKAPVLHVRQCKDFKLHRFAVVGDRPAHALH